MNKPSKLRFIEGLEVGQGAKVPKAQLRAVRILAHRIKRKNGTNFVTKIEGDDVWVWRSK